MARTTTFLCDEWVSECDTAKIDGRTSCGCFPVSWRNFLNAPSSTKYAQPLLRPGSALSDDTFLRASRKFASIARNKEYFHLDHSVSEHATRTRPIHNIPFLKRCIFPAIWKILARMGASRTQYCTSTMLCRRNPTRVMAPS